MNKEIQGQRILVVEDSLTVRVALQGLLESMGLEVVLAKDGLQCLDILQHDTPDAILLDIMMPEMNGFEVLRWIKNQPRLEDIPVIMQTAMDDTESIKRGVDEGAFYYLIKPIEVELLRSIVGAAISDFRAKKALRKQIIESENPFGLMVEGTFRFRTLTDAEYMSVRIANASPSPKKVAVINELIINAIEHGNLGITYDEKTEYIDNGTWHSEIERRLALPEHVNKNVEVKIKRYPDRMTVLITDQGSGFDFEKYLDLDESRFLHNHGRGIVMTNIFLNLQYIGTGNEVVVTIPLE